VQAVQGVQVVQAHKPVLRYEPEELLSGLLFFI